MNIFISWSGNRSRKLADILKQWLPGVLQAVRPYFSPEDVAKGSRWNSEIAKELEASKMGIICLTQDNLDANWLMFEAGALSKNLDRSRVCPILFGIEPTDVKGPLVQFQASRFEKGELKRLVKMMNGELGQDTLSSDVLDSVFEMWWPKLHERVNAALSEEIDEASTETRSERDILEEILGLTRSSGARTRAERINPMAVEECVSAFAGIVKEASSVGFLPLIGDQCRTMGESIGYLVRHGRRSAHSMSQHRRLRDVIASIEGYPQEREGEPEEEPDQGTSEQDSER